MTRSLACSLSLFFACDPPGELDAEPFRDGIGGPELITWPPPGGTLNTGSIGVTPLMRLVLPGYPTNDVRKDDGVVSLIEVLDGGQYVPVTSVSIPDGDLTLETASHTYAGNAVLGSRWWLDESHTHYVTITLVSEEGRAPGYQLEHRVLGSDASIPICEVDVDNDHWAYLVEDILVDVETGQITRDTGSVLVACSSGALGKAISWGFTPWDGQPQGPLSLYRTGVRTVMADYCGDGSTYTQNGVLIQVYNEVAGQAFGAPEEPTEAIFGPDGALCLSSPRIEWFGLGCDLTACDIEDPKSLAAPFLAWTKHGAP